MSYYEKHKETLKARNREYYSKRMAKFTTKEREQYRKERSEYFKAWYKAKRQPEPKSKVESQETTALSFSFSD